MKNSIPIKLNITDIRFSSYYSEGELLAKVSTVYLKFSNNKWYEIIISDGTSSFKECKEPIIVNYNGNKEFMFFSIQPFTSINIEELKSLVSIKEYLWKGYSDESSGFLLEFENNIFLSLFEEEEEVIISNQNEYGENYQLKIIDNTLLTGEIT